MSEPREFWIDPGRENIGATFDGRECAMFWAYDQKMRGNEIHVIEKSAYDAIVKERDKLMNDFIRLSKDRDKLSQEVAKLREENERLKSGWEFLARLHQRATNKVIPGEIDTLDAVVMEVQHLLECEQLLGKTAKDNSDLQAQVRTLTVASTKLIASVESYAESGLIENYHNDLVGGTLSDHVELMKEALTTSGVEIKGAREGGSGE